MVRVASLFLMKLASSIAIITLRLRMKDLSRSRMVSGTEENASIFTANTENPGAARNEENSSSLFLVDFPSHRYELNGIVRCFSHCVASRGGVSCSTPMAHPGTHSRHTDFGATTTIPSRPQVLLRYIAASRATFVLPVAISMYRACAPIPVIPLTHAGSIRLWCA